VLLGLCACRLGQHDALWAARTRAPLSARFAIARDAVAIPDLSDDRDDVLSCFALADGTARWQVPLDDFMVSSALAVPTVGADPDGAAIYVAQDSTVARYTAADGRRLWSGRVPPVEPFESYSIGHTPVVKGERLYLLSRSSRVVAVDRRDGTMVFRTDDTESASDLAWRAGVLVTRSLEARDVRGHDAQTGAPLWRHALKAGHPHTSRLDTSIHLARDDGAYLVADGQRALLSLDARTGAVRWEEPVVGLASYAHAGPVVVVTDSSTVRGLDAATGTLRWRHPTGGLSFVAPLDDRTVLVALSTGIATADAGTGALRRHARRGLHEQDGVLDARDGIAVITTDNGVARLYRRDGDGLVERTISDGVTASQFDHTLKQVVVAAGGAVTFNTAQRIQRFVP
jgi:outer membrane protein assembly factor BamB